MDTPAHVGCLIEVSSATVVGGEHRHGRPENPRLQPREQACHFPAVRRNEVANGPWWPEDQPFQSKKIGPVNRPCDRLIDVITIASLFFLVTSRLADNGRNLVRLI